MIARPAWGDLGIGVGTMLLAAIVGWQTSLIASGASYAQVGPHVFPWVIAAMLVLLGLALTLQAAFGWGAPAAAAEEQPAIDLRGALFMLLGLSLNVLLIERVGFILASTALFLCTARAFGSTSPLRDAAIGITLAFAAYIGFDRVLGYKIGSGLIEGLI